METLDLTSEFYTIEGIYEATDAGEYTVTLTPTEKYCWSDESVSKVDIVWVINKRILSIDIDKYYYTGKPINITDGRDLTKYCTLSGDVGPINSGGYTTTIQIKETANCVWEDGTIADKVFEWYIVEIWDGSVDTSWYNTTDKEFIISNAKQLAGLAQLVNNGNNFEGILVELDNGINLANKSWIPIGKSQSRFRGIFDGNEHTISNFRINANTKATAYSGLFGHNSGTIKNLTVKTFTISVLVFSPFDQYGVNKIYHSYAGGLAGYNSGSITNCYASGDVYAKVSSVFDYQYGFSETGNSYAGGLVGVNYKGTISNC